MTAAAKPNRRPHGAPPDTYERASDAHALVYDAQVVATEIEHVGMGNASSADLINRMTALSLVTVSLLQRAIEVLNGVIDYEPEGES
jgi:hypothetical protein